MAPAEVSERVEKYAAPRDAFRAAVRTADEATDPTEKVTHYKDAVKHLDELLKQSAVVRKDFWKGELEKAAKTLQELEVEKTRADREMAWGATRSAADSLEREARDLRERGDRGSAIKKYQEAAKTSTKLSPTKGYAKESCVRESAISQKNEPRT